MNDYFKRFFERLIGFGFVFLCGVVIVGGLAGIFFFIMSQIPSYFGFGLALLVVFIAIVALLTALDT